MKQSVSHLVNEILHLSEEDINTLYGIEIKTDGTVFDPTYNKSFDSIGEWAQFNIEQDEMEHEEHFHHNDYDDGY